MLHEATISDQILRPTHVRVDLSAITDNYNLLKAQAGGATVMCILKANAYSHGLIRVAQHLESLGAAYFGVAYLEEGIMLREAGIRTPILVLGGIIGDQIPLFIHHDLTITASSVDKLAQIETCAKKMNRKAKAHLKIDTGMERIGIHYYSAEKLIKKSQECQHTMIEGIFSHLANSETSDQSYTNLQLQRFQRVLTGYKQEELPKYVHLSNSAAAVRLENAKFNMVRIGIMLYGVKPDPELKLELSLRPALSWKTRIVYFKVIKPNHPVSYGSSWQTDRLTRIITLPVGYGDGYFRSMSNKCEVLLRGKRYPVVGSICMDQMMVDIGWDSGYNGDEVTLVGSDGQQSITIEEMAVWADTIPYEILTNINTRVQRVYVESSGD